MNCKDFIEKISRGTVEIINKDSLERKILYSQKTGIPLRVKAGFDPTAPDIHLGHVVLLRKLRQFQDFGCQIDFLVGDFTALVGDPTGKSKLRPVIDRDYIRDNAKTYTDQAFKILDREKTNVVFNGDWLHRLKPSSLLALTARSTVAQMLARNDFKDRFDSGVEISIMEFLYPLLQGFDSYFLRTDIELGGGDQRFNLLMGRQLQEALSDDESFIQEVKGVLQGLNGVDEAEIWKPAKYPQVVIMTPLLEGLDGAQKMSKSLGNYIGINDPANEIFGKVMSISDDLMWRYFQILTDVNLEEVKGLHPKEAKKLLARNIITLFSDEAIALWAEKEFENIFSQKQVPENVQEYLLKKAGEQCLVDLLVSAGCVGSKKEVKRLLSQGAISFEGQKINNEGWILKRGVIKIGKRRFLKLV